MALRLYDPSTNCTYFSTGRPPVYLGESRRPWLWWERWANYLWQEGPGLGEHVLLPESRTNEMEPG